MRRNDRGAVAVLVAILLVVILGMAALAIDGGGLYMQRRRMVGATDAATIAAAQWCAQHVGQVLLDSAPLDTYADTTASNNVDLPHPATRVGSLQFGATTDQNPTNTNPCNVPLGQPVPTSGKVWAKYMVPEVQGFAPILDPAFGNNHDVTARANAVWGAAGGHTSVVPLMLSQGRLTNCDFQPPWTQLIVDVSECNFFWDNGSTNPQVLGHAEWGTVDLSTWGPPYLLPGANCPGNASLNDIKSWINGGYPGSLILKAPPPTYVCKGVGNFGNALDNTISGHIGETVPFPINDPQQQVDRNGNICTPQMIQSNACTMDKFAMTAFASLKIVAIYTYNGPNRAIALAKCPPPVLTGLANARCLSTVWEGIITDGIIGGGGGSNGNSYAVSLTG